MLSTKTDFDLTRLSRTPAAQKLAITVLSGGPGAEREISFQSGKAVAAALESLGHAVFLEDVGPQNLAGLAREVDCVFNALHGTFGEDGQVQDILERRGLRYCGSGPDACALAMNKAMAKRKFDALGLPTPRYDIATKDTMRQAMACWNLPVVVKPVKEGSSLACHIVRDFGQFRTAVEAVIEKYGECLVEEYIPGKEIAVGVLGDRALPPIEIVTQRDFYDYQAKYVDEDTKYLFDIDLPRDLLEHVAAMSLRAHRELGCRDFSRVDWRIDPSRPAPYLLEVNVIPGFTTHSLLPKAAEKVGLSMPMLCQFIVESGVKRGIS
ncbi:MAG: D-alanine--D-alanine ligase [Planctomycetota bacterium]|nr:D-alanine--D-alanine ligase [Planctomycetota bacterium]